MNYGVCDEMSAPKHRMGGPRDLEQDICSSISCWPVYWSAFSRETEPIDRGA